MNEAETRAERIDPALKQAGWGVMADSKILREYPITAGKLQSSGGRSKKWIADYILVYKGIKLAVVEAKSDDLAASEGVAQAKLYAEKLKLETTYATNGKAIYQICMKTGAEGEVHRYLSPDELWQKTFPDPNDWREKWANIPFETKSGTWTLRYYQEIAVQKTLEALANHQNRLLLTLATGTGKTAIAFQIAWKLFQTRWNLNRDGKRRPRILFLADRNILADQAYNSFSAFPEDALVRISPKEIAKKGAVPTNGSIFFTIFQTFMSGTDAEGNPTPSFGAYPPDYFDFIIVDECHRGGAKEEGNWRAILEYFSAAVQLGLTATPKRTDNVDTYQYFGEPIYIYSLREGIENGFLTPFKVKKIQTTLDDYVYTQDDFILEGEIKLGKKYVESDFNRQIEIKAREAHRVKWFMDDAHPADKTIIFCATQEHAALIRDLVNQYKQNPNPNYCVRVTAADGDIGEQFLRTFQDNDKNIPTILTTSQKLSTGVDARNIRNIVLLRPVNSMIEFKQIVGRGTRLFDGKTFFTVYDFVQAHAHFEDTEWDGEPLPPENEGWKEPEMPYQKTEIQNSEDATEKNKKIKIKLRDGKEREIQSIVSTLFWSADGKPLSAEAFLNQLLGELPNHFKSETELRQLWSHPTTRRALLDRLEYAGFGKNELIVLQQLINAEKSDLYDVLEYVFNGVPKFITRAERVAFAQPQLLSLLNPEQQIFIDFVLRQYIETGVDELEQTQLPILLKNKYQSVPDAVKILGNVAQIRTIFVAMQAYLYAEVI
jgi:type I restriction enzyme R subunit